MPGALSQPTLAQHDDDIVITGLSGRLPDSDSIEEFAQHLFDGVDLVSADDRRWTPGLHGLPERNGKLKDLVHFDATHFGVHAKQAHLMDPQLRLLLELTHEAMVDAGVSPQELRGSRTGCYVGVSNSETEEMWTAEPDKINGYALTGCCRAMFPNRISYTFDLRGPSYAVDTACSSSMFALAQAVSAMKAGQCDAAVVGGTNLCLKPGNSLNFHRLSMLSPEGKCAAFDANGAGYVRSEAAVVVLVQRRRDARRVYATVRGARTNTDGFKDQGITFPSGDMQRRLATETFKEAGLKPSDVAYVEAHGTGTKVGDPQEVNAIAKLFCEGRTTPLLLGSVKSNMGHSEPASGLCSIAKCVIAMERGVIPQNLHFKSPNPDIPALNDGRIKVVDKNTPWDGGLVAVNSFGFGGANAHIILESERSSKATCSPYGLPRVVVASGRTEEAVHSLLEVAASHPKDQHLHALMDAVHAHNIPAHMYRGHRVITDGDTPVEQIEELEGSERREMWWVFSGMGSQWAGMAKTLLALPVYAESIRRSAAALRPHGLDLVRLITEAPDSAFDDVVNSFVSIAAGQVAFVDVLRAAKLTPDGIVGHSVGEVGCAYADGTLTGEQAVLAAYMRGRSIVEAKLAPGAMAAVGLSWAECVKRCPSDIQPACHNAPDSVTISGPPASIDKFVAELTAEGTFARRVNSSGVAFHSKYIATAAPKLLDALKRIITDPKPRSKKWISTSIPKDKWDSEMARYSSAEYHVNNLTSSVNFAEAIKEIPPGSIVVEVAPHALLQAVLRRACTGSPIIGLVRKDQPDPCMQVLAALGRIFAAGGQPAVGELYPRIKWPVPRGTPTLASHVKWDHSIEWDVANYGKASRGGESVIEFDLSKNEDSFIEGHTIDGRILFPATGYLTLVWRTMARLHNKKIEETAIVLEDVQFSRATIMSREAPTRFLVNVLEGSGDFEVQEGGGVAVSGRVRLAETHAEERLKLGNPAIPNKVSGPSLSHEDIYKELRLRGYHYGGIFRGINDAESHARIGHIKWADNWISFMDNMLQFAILGVDSRQLYLPTRLQRAHIDPTLHAKHTTESEMIDVHHHQELGVIRAGGVELRGVKTSLAPRRANTQAPPKLERYVFVPYDNMTVMGDDSAKTKKDALTVCVQTVLENVGTLRLKVVEPAFGRNHDSLLTTHVVGLLDGEPQVRAECAVLEPAAAPAMTAALQPLGVRVQTKDITTTPLESDCTLILAADVIARHPSEVLANLTAGLAPNGMMILEEPHIALENPKTKDMLKKNNLELLMRQRACTCEYILLRLIREVPKESVTIYVKEDEFSWVEELKVAMKRAETEDMRIYLMSSSPESGILGLTTCVRSEGGGGAVRAVWSPNNKMQSMPDALLRRDLTVNVLQDNVWGCYRHVLLNDPAEATLQVKHAYVNTLTRGDLSSLRWIESPLGVSDETDDKLELCAVHYAPLNFRDIMLATGKLPPDALPGGLAGQDCILGLEFSGKSQNGKRVMGMVAAQGLATAVRVDPAFLWPVPEKWSLEQAATVPVAYATAYYALSVRGRMCKGESVLIHAGSGGVGQAAISIALHAGCTVYTTVGTPDKRAYLRKTFPNLPDEHIGNSRDTSFEQMIMTRTNGRGVDLVLNSLAADKLQASVRCLAEGGRFLEIGKLDLSNNTPLGMAIFLKNTTFHGILLDALFDPRSNSGDRLAVVKCVNEGIINGAVRPLPSTVYTSQQLEAAFRFMATGKHIGKVVIQVREEEARSHSVCASPRMYCTADSTHVLVGGLGGFGLELAEWLVRRGAKCIVLTSRSGVKTGYQAACIRRWRQAGVKVEISTADVTTAQGAKELLKEANKLAPVAAVYNLAAVLRDAFMENQTAEDFKIVAAPKIDGTRNLDMATRDLCPSLRHFVVFSSVSCGRGNAGQSNYGLANSYMERVCERRHRDGLPALAVQWGAIGDVGLVADMGGDDLVVGGTLPQKIASCLDTLGALMSLPHPVTATMVLADKRKAASTGGQKDLVHAVANILGLKDPSKASDSATLADLGMDSLMGAEIKQTLERGYDLVLGVQEIRTLTFGKLKAMGGGGDDSVGTGDVTSTPATEEKLMQFSAEELIPKEVVIPLTSSGGDKNVFMIHPIEGSVAPLSQIAKSVKAKVYGLQCARDAPLESMSALARHYVSVVRDIQPRPPYMLFGYSFGAGVAFEMALQLEKAGCTCRLVLLDGSPAYLSTHTRKGKSKRTGPRSPAADEADALAYFTQQFQQDLDVVKLSSEMERLPSWEDRVKMVTRLVPVPSQDLAAAATAFYRKLVISDTYTPTAKLKAPVDLFTATDNYVTLEGDYGLGSVCTGPVNTRQLTGDHRSILTGEPAKTIAEHLSSIITKTN